jgi:DNA-binding NtrC family response regulator
MLKESCTYAETGSDHLRKHHTGQDGMSIMSAPKQKRKDRAEAPLAGGKRTILIYSSDLNFCFSLSMLFQDRYNVITTTNPVMMPTLVSDYSADLLIVDAVPSEQLLERLDGVREINAGLPIIMLYVYSPKLVHLENAVRSHVNSLFYKPFDLNVVSKAIEELLPGLPR